MQGESGSAEGGPLIKGLVVSKVDEWLNFYFIIPSKGIRLYTAKIIWSRRKKRRNVIFQKDGFLLYHTRRGNLMIQAPSRSPRRIRRFLRDYAKTQDGKPQTVSFWISPFKCF